jgi:sporulation protein YlmC with PRC-barrel domain
MNLSQSDTSALEKLKDTDLAISVSDDDVRGRRVIDSHGKEIGHVSSLFVDHTERKVRVLELRVGGLLGLGEQHVLLPAEAITSVAADSVHVNQTREHVVHSPTYDPTLVVAATRLYLEPYYGHYGVAPHWGTGQSPGIGIR